MSPDVALSQVRSSRWFHNHRKRLTSRSDSAGLIAAREARNVDAEDRNTLYHGQGSQRPKDASVCASPRNMVMLPMLADHLVLDCGL